jgi:hypothetical protein
LFATLYGTLRRDCRTFRLLEDGKNQIPEHKKSRLNDLALYIESKLKSGIDVKMVFISPTDNGFSQLGQVWAKALSVHKNLDDLEAFSAGIRTETINSIVLAVISKYGFEIKKAKNGSRPVCNVKFADNVPCIKLFSNPLHHQENPGAGYVALIINPTDTETHLTGADFKVPLNYDICPTEQEQEKYARIFLQIGADLLYVFSLVHG